MHALMLASWTRPVVASICKVGKKSFQFADPKCIKYIGWTSRTRNRAEAVTSSVAKSMNEEVTTILEKLDSCSFAREATIEDVRPGGCPISRRADDETSLLEIWKRFILHGHQGEEGLSEFNPSDLASDVKAHLSPNLSWQQILAFARATSFSWKGKNLHSEFVSDVSNHLDKVCSQKLEAEDQTLFADKTFRSVLLELAFLRTKSTLKHLVNREGSVMFKKTLVQSVFNEKWFEKLHKDEFVFLSHLAGQSRHLPGTSLLAQGSDIRKERYALPDQLLAKIEALLPELDLGETGILANALYNTRIKLTHNNAPVRKHLFRVLLCSHDEEIINYGYSVTSILKLLKDRGDVEVELIEKLMDRIQPLLSRLTPYSQIRLTRLLMICSEFEGASSVICTFATSIKHHLRSVRMKDLDQICQILQFFNYTADMSVYQAVEEAVSKRKANETHVGKYIISVITSFSRMGRFNMASIEKLFHHANGHTALLQAQDQKKLSEACAVLCFELFRDLSSRRILNLELRRNNADYFRALCMMAELDCSIEIELPDHSGERLDRRLRDKIFSFNEKEPASTRACGVRHQVLADMEHELGRNAIFFGHTFPHAFIPSIVFCLRNVNRMQAAPLPRAFTDELREAREIVSPSQTLGKWFAMLVPRESDLDHAGRPYGLLLGKMRQLKMLGYVPVVVPHDAYARARRAVEGKAFLKELIYLGVSQETKSNKVCR